MQRTRNLVTRVTSDRSGKIKVTTAILLLVVAHLVFFGFQYGAVYFRKYRLQSAMNEELSYAGQRVDASIRQRLAEDIERLNLPPAARSFQFARVGNPRALQVSISYVETVNLLYTKKRMRVTVQTRRPF